VERLRIQRKTPWRIDSTLNVLSRRQTPVAATTVLFVKRVRPTGGP
jgi:hypothetical protein